MQKVLYRKPKKIEATMQEALDELRILWAAFVLKNTDGRYGADLHVTPKQARYWRDLAKRGTDLVLKARRISRD